MNRAMSSGTFLYAFLARIITSQTQEQEIKQRALPAGAFQKDGHLFEKACSVALMGWPRIRSNGRILRRTRLRT